MNMIKKIAPICLLLSVNLFGQDVAAPIPVDQSITKGVLNNGLTYYIKQTDVVEDAASYYIIQNVGSVLENDDQQGLAHFLEHMAFNGTENFPGKGILNTFQENGLVFGMDINAYTGFDETVYNINNVPTTPELIETSLLVLHDWCNYLSLTDEEIDAERGVIKEEWRSRQTGQMRLFEKSLSVTYNQSKYARRLPIGLMDIVENFEYETLRDFYHDWYRTDLQAIAIIGDVDVDEIEGKIKNLFSEIRPVAQPRERPIIQVPENQKMLYNQGMDKEVSTVRLSFGIRHENSLADETIEDLRNSLVQSMVINMLSARIREKSQNPDAHFLNANTEYKPISRANSAFMVNVLPKIGKQQEAFSQVFTEVFRAVKFGFTQSEIDRTMKSFSNRYENQIAKISDRGHKSIINSIKDNYLGNKTLADITQEYDIVKKLFASFTTETLHNGIKKLYTKNNRFLNVTGAEGRNNLTEEQANTIINDIESKLDLAAYVDEFAGKTLTSGLKITEGSISKLEKNELLGSTTYTLSNGIKVHYKYADKQKNTVAFTAISPGGNSLVTDKDLPSAYLLGDMLSISGLGEYSATELRKILAGKTASMTPVIGETTESLQGNSSTKDVETMLQMAHLYFAKPRFNEQTFEVLQGNIKNYLVRRSKDIREKIKDSITTTLYRKDHPRKRPFNEEFANDVTFDQIKSVYASRFANPADFEFFIVGDVEAAQLEPMLSTYIASLPTTTATETFKDVTPAWVARKTDKDIYLAMEDPKTHVNISFKVANDYTIKNKYVTQALGAILQLRLTEKLREEEGGVYSPRAQAFLIKEPKVLSYLSIKFDCNPELAEKLIGIVHDELLKLTKGNIRQEDLEKTLTSYNKAREQSKSYNNYDMTLLTTFYRDGYNINDPKNFEEIISDISEKDIQNLANQLKEKGSSFEIVFKPLMK